MGKRTDTPNPIVAALQIISCTNIHELSLKVHVIFFTYTRDLKG